MLVKLTKGGRDGEGKGEVEEVRVSKGKEERVGKAGLK